MSFRCQRCGVAFPNEQHPNVKRPITVVTDVRPRRYHAGQAELIPGWEIGKEQKICEPCLPSYTPPTVNLSIEDKNEHLA